MRQNTSIRNTNITTDKKDIFLTEISSREGDIINISTGIKDLKYSG